MVVLVQGGRVVDSVHPNVQVWGGEKFRVDI